MSKTNEEVWCVKCGDTEFIIPREKIIMLFKSKENVHTLTYQGGYLTLTEDTYNKLKERFLNVNE